jgi:hypothetical protein
MVELPRLLAYASFRKRFHEADGAGVIAAARWQLLGAAPANLKAVEQQQRGTMDERPYQRDTLQFAAAERRNAARLASARQTGVEPDRTKSCNPALRVMVAYELAAGGRNPLQRLSPHLAVDEHAGCRDALPDVIGQF